MGVFPLPSDIYLPPPQRVELAPTADLDRTGDRIYDCTTEVVRTVMALSRGVQAGRASRYLDLVKDVGYELRELLASVDGEVPAFPASAHREVREGMRCGVWSGCGCLMLLIPF